MKAKKNPKANLENKKSIFLEIGFIVAFATVLFAFEWKISDQEISDFITVSEIPTEPEMVPVTIMQQLPPPPPIVVKPIDMLEIVDELDEATEDVELTDVTDDSENNNVNIDYTDIDYGPENVDEVLQFVPSEDMPIFPGNINKWISQNIKYPPLAADNGIQGKVYLKFVVEKDGSISNIEVIRGVDPSLDKEAVRVISKMPKWKPGKQRGKPVRVSYNLPITFQLNRN